MFRSPHPTGGWGLLALGTALALVATTPGAAPVAEKPPLTFAAGRPQGNYKAVADALAAEMADGGRTLRVVETQGSYDNADRLRDGDADLALLQSDVAYLEHYNQRPFVALASLYTEPVHVVAYHGLGLRRLSDLLPLEEPLTVAVGAPGSGSSAHALALLEQLGLPPERLTITEESIDQAAAGLRNRDVDLAFVTSAVPSPTIEELADARIVSLLDVDSDIARRLRRRNTFFVAAEIPYEAYKASRRNVQTLGTRTLLVARPDLATGDVESVLGGLYAVAERADGGRLSFLTGLSPASAVADPAIPFHPAAKRYHEARLGILEELLDTLRRNAVLLLLLGLVAVAVWRLSRFAYFVHQFVLGRVLVSLVAVWLLGSAAMHFFEGDKNSAFRSFGSSSIAILHYLFSGLETVYPVTPGGNVVAILVLSLGVGVVTLFTATVVTLLVERALNIKTLRTKPAPFIQLSGHTVIAGWSDRTRRIIRQLRSPDLRRQPTVVVIAPRAAETRVEARRNYRGVWVVEGDPSHRRSLELADITTAAHAIVPAGETGEPHADLSSICCTLAIERLAPDVHTVVEAHASAAVEHLDHCRADEVVDAETIARRMVSQCVITPGIAEVYGELLSFGRDSQEIYLVPLAGELDGLSFDEVRDRLRPCDAIVLGFWRHGETRARINPRPAGRNFQLRAGGRPDRLVVLADSPRALTAEPCRNTETADDAGAADRPASAETAAATTGPGEPVRCERIGLCGWGDEARTIVDELRGATSVTHRRFEIVVIAPADALPAEGERPSGVHFVAGDPARQPVLEEAGVADLRSLVVLADRSDPTSRHHSDHRGLMVCLAARAVCSEVHLVVEVLAADNREHYHHLQGVEIVSADDLAEKLLAQAVINPGIPRVFLDLLTADGDSNEIYVVPVPRRWRGMAFEDAALAVEGGQPTAIALGYRTPQPDGAPVTVLNPGRRKGERRGVTDWRRHPLGESDALVVMAYEAPVW